jgi:hypothetical protein
MNIAFQDYIKLFDGISFIDDKTQYKFPNQNFSIILQDLKKNLFYIAPELIPLGPMYPFTHSLCIKQHKILETDMIPSSRR